MNAGRIEQVGAPLELYDRPESLFVAGFIGSPSMNFLNGVVNADDDGFRFRADGGCSFQVSPEIGSQAGGRALVVGIRPEHIELANGGDGPGLDARVVVDEPTGSETQITATVGGDEILAVFKDRLAASAGADLRIAFPADRFHLFDKETGERIGR